MNWNDPQARAALMYRVGVAEYNRRHAVHHQQSVEATVNGYDIRIVGSAFGQLHAVAGTRRAFSTLEEAVAFAASLPSGRK
jgi:hypothetical protein